MWGRTILYLGVHWRIGDWNSTSILNDPWIPRSFSFKVYDKLFLPGDLKVIDFKGLDGQWDKEMVKCLFNNYDARIIMSIPCADHSLEDKILWHHTKNGEYSVEVVTMRL